MFRLRHHDKEFNLKITTKLTVIKLMLTFGVAMVVTFWSMFIYSFGFSESEVGYFSSILILLSLIFSIYSSEILEFFGERRSLFFGVGLTIVFYFIFAFVENLYLFLILAILCTIIAILRDESFAILFRDSSSNKELNENEGFLFSIINVGWLVAPMLAGYLLESYGFSGMFIMAAIFLLIGLVLIVEVKSLKKVSVSKKLDKNIIRNLKEFFSNKKLIKPYVISAAIAAWWAFVYVYMPLFLMKEGISLENIGLFFAILIVPLILIEYTIGKISERKGFKIFFVSGFLLLGIISVLMFFYTEVHLVMFLTIIASIPAAFIEPLRDAYFFKQVNKKNEDKFFPIQYTSLDIGGLIGKLPVATLLLFLPFNYTFLFIGLMMLLVGVISLGVKD